MKRGKGITINLSNKVAYTLIAIFILAVIGGVVFAYNSNPADPAVFGHSADEIDGLDEMVGGNLEIKVFYYAHNAMDNGGGSYKWFSCPSGYSKMIACGCNSNGYANKCSAAVRGNSCFVSASLGAAVSITCVKDGTATVIHA
jgi:hypothetical protein